MTIHRQRSVLRHFRQPRWRWRHAYFGAHSGRKV